MNVKECECGCGSPAPIAKRTNRSDGAIKGFPQRFIRGHSMGGKYGAENPNWKGGVFNRADGYAFVRSPTHAKATKTRRYFYEHILIAEKAIGRCLPDKAVVHHVNQIPSDNRNNNLVICQDNSYHRLIHRRMRAYSACGNASAVMCSHCRSWGIAGAGDMSSVIGLGNHRQSYHKSCEARRAKDRRLHKLDERGRRGL